jgi:hypothetical protein
MTRLVTLLAGVCGVTAVVCVAAGLVPYDKLQPLGALVRHPEDVTPERYGRYLQATWGFAAAFALLGGWLWRHHATTARFLGALRHPPQTPEAAPFATSPSGGEWTVIGIIVLVGAALRLSQLDGPMAYDEAYTWINFARRPWYEAIGDYNSTNNHLLNTLLVHVCGRVFGPEEWALRLPVFLLGTALPLVVWRWGREWRGPDAAVLAATLTAVAPALISYSVDARGYMYVAVAAVVLDAALGRLQRCNSARAWLAVWLALTLGLCAMPLMVYPALAALGWFVLSPRCVIPAGITAAGDGFVKRLRSLGPLLALSGLCVALFYTPAYLFRGFQFLRDPILQSPAAGEFFLRLANSWQAAAVWWIDGVVPAWLWGLLAVVGVVLWRGELGSRGRWLAPFVVFLGLNVVQRVAPPPRVFLHLAPWAFLLVAEGTATAWRWGASRVVPVPRSEFPVVRSMLAACLLVAGANEFLRRPVPFFPEERTSYVSVPAVITRLRVEVAARPQERHVLLAPLPCDLPAIFYLERLGLRVAVNIRPAPGDRVWLIARRHEAVVEVLGSDLIRCADLAQDFTPWQRVAEFTTLRLWTAVLQPASP